MRDSTLMSMSDASKVTNDGRG